MRFTPPLPSFGDWLRTLLLVVLMAFWGFVGAKPMEWGGFGVLFGALVFPIVSTAVIHHVLWGKRSKIFPIWVPSALSWNEALWWYWAAVAFFFYLLILVLGGILFLLILALILQKVMDPDTFNGMVSTIGEIVKAKIESWQYIDPANPPKDSPAVALLSWVGWAYSAALTFRKQRLRAASKVKTP